MKIAKRSPGSLETKALRQKIGDRALLRAFFTVIEDHGIRPKFINNLSTRAARRTRNSLAVDDGDRAILKLRTIRCNRGKYRGTLGAVGHSVRGIFDVTSDENFSLRGQDCSSYPEV